MRFYDANGALIFQSIQINLPRSYFTSDSGIIILTTPTEFNYINKDTINNDMYVLCNSVITGQRATWDMANGSRLVIDKTDPATGVYNELQNPDWEPLWLRTYMGGAGYSRGGGYWFQPDGAGARYWGTIQISYNQYDEISQIQIYYYDITQQSEERQKIIQEFFYGINTSEEDYSEAGIGGNGDYSEITKTTDIDFPSMNIIGLYQTKMIHSYALTLQQCADLSSWFWDDNIIEQIKKAFADPMDAILSLGILPFSIPCETTPTNLKIGLAESSTAQGHRVTSEWVIIDCGHFDFVEAWGSFIDYTNTDITLYLPFIGEQKLNIQEVMSSRLHLKYYVDIITGNCTALLKITKNVDNKRIAPLNSVLYNWTGNMLTSCALTGADFSTRYVSMITNTAMLAGEAIATGGVSLGGALTGANNILSNYKAKIQRTGNVEANNGMMSIRKPVITITRPIQNIPETYNHNYGKPSNVTLKLSQCYGYTKIGNIVLDNIPCTDDERNELKTLLTNGVYF